jgi:hypothetical protein
VIHAGNMSFRGEQLSYVVVFLGKLAPDVHRELHRVVVMGNLVAVELSIRGTFSGPSRPRESFSRPEPSSMYHAPTSGL